MDSSCCSDVGMSEKVQLGTTIIAVSFNGGVILGADSRTSTGSYIANRVTDKLTPLADNIYMCRSGSAADTQAIASYVQFYIAQHQAQIGEEIEVHTAASLVQQMAYSNKNMLEAGMIVAGHDSVAGGTVYAVPLGGTLMKVCGAVCISADKECSFAAKQGAPYTYRTMICIFSFTTNYRCAPITCLGDLSHCMYLSIPSHPAVVHYCGVPYGVLAYSCANIMR